MQTLETRLDGRGVRVGVIVARFNHLITLRLLEGCLARLAELGCDDTPHFEYVCQGVTDGVGRVALSEGVPIAFCVLTTETVEQALVRAVKPGEAGCNKGAEAAEVAVELVSLARALDGRS